MPVVAVALYRQPSFSHHRSVTLGSEPGQESPPAACYDGIRLSESNGWMRQVARSMARTVQSLTMAEAIRMGFRVVGGMAYDAQGNLIADVVGFPSVTRPRLATNWPGSPTYRGTERRSEDPTPSRQEDA